MVYYFWKIILFTLHRILYCDLSKYYFLPCKFELAATPVEDKKWSYKIQKFWNNIMDFDNCLVTVNCHLSPYIIEKVLKIPWINTLIVTIFNCNHYFICFGWLFYCLYSRYCVELVIRTFNWSRYRLHIIIINNHYHYIVDVFIFKTRDIIINEYHFIEFII